MIAPDSSRDSAVGVGALKYLFNESLKRGYQLPATDAAAFISSLRLDPLTIVFPENLGYAIRSLQDANHIDADETTDALNASIDEIQGNWHPRFSPQTITQNIIDEAKSLKARWIYQSTKEMSWDRAWNAYAYAEKVVAPLADTVINLAEGAKEVAASSGTIIKWTIPAVLVGGGLVLYMWGRPIAKAAAAAISRK